MTWRSRRIDSAIALNARSRSETELDLCPLQAVYPRRKRAELPSSLHPFGGDETRGVDGILVGKKSLWTEHELGGRSIKTLTIELPDDVTLPYGGSDETDRTRAGLPRRSAGTTADRSRKARGPRSPVCPGPSSSTHPAGRTSVAFRRRTRNKRRSWSNRSMRVVNASPQSSRAYQCRA
jgi:hypothetical protein